MKYRAIRCIGTTNTEYEDTFAGSGETWRQNDVLPIREEFVQRLLEHRDVFQDIGEFRRVLDGQNLYWRLYPNALAIDQAAFTITTGNTRTLSVTGALGTVNWSVSPLGAGTFSPTSGNTVTFIAGSTPGAIVISANDGSTTATLNAMIAAANPTTVSIAPSTFTVAVGLTQTLTATVANGSGTTSWSASPAGRVSFNQTTGNSVIVTGLSAGSVTVTAANSGVQSTATGTVSASADATPPTVTLTAPTSGSTVSGTITLSATASDNVGVVGVTFLVDGQVIPSEDTTSPFSISYNTALLSNGAHTFGARARDAAGNLGTATGVAVTVNNVVDTTRATRFVLGPATITADATFLASMAVVGTTNDDATAQLSYPNQTNDQYGWLATTAAADTAATLTAPNGRPKFYAQLAGNSAVSQTIEEYWDGAGATGVGTGPLPAGTNKITATIGGVAWVFRRQTFPGNVADTWFIRR